jgi:hypothetical protein
VTSIVCEKRARVSVNQQRVFVFLLLVMSDLQSQFTKATQHVSLGEIQLNDEQRSILYGLQKQVLNGNVNVAEPPK